MSGVNRAVHPQITDAVTQVSSHVLSLGPASAAIGAYLGQAQAQSVLAANLVNQQQQQALTSMSTTVQNIGRLMAIRRNSGVEVSRSRLPQDVDTAVDVSSKVPMSGSLDDSATMYQRPVVT